MRAMLPQLSRPCTATSTTQVPPRVGAPQILGTSTQACLVCMRTCT